MTYPVILPGSGGRPFGPLANLVAAYSRSCPPPVLVMGDSVLLRVATQDQDRRNLAAMIDDALGTQIASLSIAYTAYNFRIFHALARLIACLPYRPKVIVVPINMRSFSPQWDLNPVWQLDAHLSAIEQCIRDPERGVAEIPDIVRTPSFYDEFDATPVSFELSELRTLGEFRSVAQAKPTAEDDAAKRARTILVWHYAYRLIDDHRLLRSMQQFIQACEQAQIGVLAYFTPLNVGHGLYYVGEGFRRCVRQNVDLVARRCRALGVKARDWTGALPQDAFFHTELATEHLSENGRCWLAGVLASEITGNLTGR